MGRVDGFRRCRREAGQRLCRLPDAYGRRQRDRPAPRAVACGCLRCARIEGLSVASVRVNGAVAANDDMGGEARQSSGARIYGVLREQILSLELVPNAELDEVQLSRELGVSRPPIHEALIRLASADLVVLAPNRGQRVAPLDLDQVPQLVETLELYERAPTRWAAQRREPHHLAAM